MVLVFTNPQPLSHEITTFTISNKETEDMKLVKSLQKSGLLIKGFREIIEMGKINKKMDFLECYSVHLEPMHLHDSSSVRSLVLYTWCNACDGNDTCHQPNATNIFRMGKAIVWLHETTTWNSNSYHFRRL